MILPRISEQEKKQEICTFNEVEVRGEKIYRVNPVNFFWGWFFLELRQFCFFSSLVFFALFPLNSNSLDEMGGRINELEQSINDLRAEMGVEGSPSPLPPSKQNPSEGKQEGSA